MTARSRTPRVGGGMTGRSSNTPNVPNSHPKFLPSQSRPKTNYSNYSDKPLVNRQRAATGTTKSMAERINERLAQVAASRIQTDDTNEMEEYSRPFTPTDHALTARPRLEEMGLFILKHPQRTQLSSQILTITITTQNKLFQLFRQTPRKSSTSSHRNNQVNGRTNKRATCPSCRK